jgi:hypothetical protein
VGLSKQVKGVDMSPSGVTNDTPTTTVKWPVEIDLIFCQGLKTISLIAQHSEIKNVIQDVIDNL